MPHPRIQPATSLVPQGFTHARRTENTGVPGRLDIKEIENRLAVPTPTTVPKLPTPSRDIARTLLAARSTAPVYAAPNPRTVDPCWQPGTLIASGAEAEIREAAHMHGQVLKLFKPGIAAIDIRAELDAMNGYHGAGFVHVSPDGRVLRMPRIDGVPLHCLTPGQALPDLRDRILACVERIIDAGIYPEDLCEANFIYDIRTGNLAPIDLKSRAPAPGQWQSWIESFRGEVRNLMAVAERAAAPDHADKSVRFAQQPQGGITGGSWRDVSSRVAVRFRTLTKALSVLNSGLPIPTRNLRKLLLMSLAVNTDHQLVSPRSEKFLLKALDEVHEGTKDTYAAGSLPFDVLQSFVRRGQQVRPDLFPIEPGVPRASAQPL